MPPGRASSPGTAVSILQLKAGKMIDAAYVLYFRRIADGTNAL
ncbi:MAG: hypothetical protein ABIU77_06830 [Ferruginibacter sp.]